MTSTQLQTPAALETLRGRFFKGYPLVRLQGQDAFAAVDDGTGKVVGVSFPVRFAAGSKIDVRATLHEMGHFATLPERRCVRDSFGFKPGVPDLDFAPWNRMPTSSNSLKVEAAAMAWEIVLAQALYDVTLAPEDVADSLVYANDFDFYPGAGKQAKLDAATNAVANAVESSGGIAQFEAVWNARMSRLPDLIEYENARNDALSNDGVTVESVHGFYDDWNMTILRHDFRGGEVYEVLFQSDGGLDPTSEDFDTMAGAKAWVASVARNYAVECHPEKNSDACHAPMRM